MYLSKKKILRHKGLSTLTPAGMRVEQVSKSNLRW